MQGEKEMKGKGSTPCRHCAGTGGGGTDIRTDGQTDQATRLLEFHMLYGTKKNTMTYSFLTLTSSLDFG